MFEDKMRRITELKMRLRNEEMKLVLLRRIQQSQLLPPPVTTNPSVSNNKENKVRVFKMNFIRLYRFVSNIELLPDIDAFHGSGNDRSTERTSVSHGSKTDAVDSRNHHHHLTITGEISADFTGNV